MRLFAITGVLALGAACSSNSQFQHQSVLTTETRGLALENDSSAQAGMMSNTCQIEVASGGIGMDVDVANDTDVVLDAAFGDVLVLGGDGLHRYTPNGFGWTDDAPIEVDAGIIDGHLTDGGWVSVGGLDGATISFNDDTTVNVPGAVHESTVDRSTDTVFTGGDAVYEVTPEGAVAIGEGNLVSWDSAVDVLYTATQGDTHLIALEASGDVRFDVVLEGAIQDVEAMGDLGAASVMVDLGAGGGLIVMIDGITGEVLSTLPTPDVAESLTSSPSGRTLAVDVGSDITHFFRVRGTSL